MRQEAIQNWQLRKPAVSSKRGLVSAQNLGAARIGARVLAEGGNAVDAAVATALALGVVEPWMSGIGGGGLMTLFRAADRSLHVVDFTMTAPSALDPEAYPLAEGEGGDLFTWPRVRGDANVTGAKSICVPGAVDGLALALARFGTVGFDRALAPAIDLAEGGVAANWFTTLVLAAAQPELARFHEAASVFLPGGHVPAPPAGGGAAPVIRQPKLAATLRRLAEDGPRAFYEGPLAEGMARDVQAAGGFLSAEDMAACRAEVKTPLSFSHNGAGVHTTPGLTAGPTLRAALDHLGEADAGDGPLDAPAMVAIARALQSAYEERFANMGHAGRHNSCTTHLNVVDAEGNMVALTNTLLSRFGSKVLLPESGVLMNNGVMWFDPRPGRPNSIAAGARPLCNMCPTIISRDGQAVLALGAAGGRQIVSAVCQLIAHVLDHGMSPEEAIHQPRLDMSGGPQVTLDARLPAGWIETIAAAMPAVVAESVVYPVRFALASMVARDPASGLNTGTAEPSHPLSGTARESDG